MDAKALDDSIQFVADTAAEIVKVKDAGGWSLGMLEDMLRLGPEAVAVVNETGDLLPELKTLDQATAVTELAKSYVALRALVEAVLYKPAAKA